MNEKIAAEKLRETAARFRAELARASLAQWQFRPSASHWSMAEVTEHVALSNGNIGRMLSTRILGSPIGSQVVAVRDDEIPYLFYRAEEPPNIAQPTGALADVEAGADAIDASADSILQWVSGVTLDLRTVASAHPVFGLMDGVQWLLFVSAHIERHRAQILGLKRHPDFPA